MTGLSGRDINGKPWRRILPIRWLLLVLMLIWPMLISFISFCLSRYSSPYATSNLSTGLFVIVISLVIVECRLSKTDSGLRGED